MKADVADISIQQLFSHNVPFVVPQYQRDYAWDNEEIKDFITDVDRLQSSFKNEYLIGSPQMRHFFGGIVCINKSPLGTTIPYYEIVDGQQRLTTITITLNEIVKSFNILIRMAKKCDNEEILNMAESYHSDTTQKYLQMEQLVNDIKQTVPRLKLSKADNDFFSEFIIKGNNVPAQRESHERIIRAENLIFESLIKPIQNLKDSNDEPDLNQIFEKLKILLRVITADFHIIHILSENKKEAYRLFSTLNDRGRSLGDGDLLRSYTLECTEEFRDIQDKIADFWDTILSKSPSYIDSFLRSYYASYVGKRAPMRELYDFYVANIFNNADKCDNRNEAEKVLQAMNDISKEFSLYNKLIIGEWPYSEKKVSEWEIDRLSRLVNVLDHTLCIPLLLSASNYLEQEKFSKIITMLERFVFRYKTITNVHIGKLSNKYYEESKKIRKLEKDYDTFDLKEILTELMQNDASDRLFKSNLKEKLYYSSKSSSQKRLIKHFLTTLEDYFRWVMNGAPVPHAPDKTRVFDLDELTIEHIYPQNPTINVEELNEFTDQIGNLTFWGPNDNRKAGNLPFSEKKEAYTNSQINLNKELGKYEDWDKSNFEKREIELLKMACKIFVP